MRTLAVMAEERKHVEGELVAWQMAWTALKLTGERIDPRQLHPYRKPPPQPPKTQAQFEREKQAAWKLIDRWFTKGR